MKSVLFVLTAFLCACADKQINNIQDFEAWSIRADESGGIIGYAPAGKMPLNGAGARFSRYVHCEQYRVVSDELKIEPAGNAVLGGYGGMPAVIAPIRKAHRELTYKCKGPPQHNSK